MDADHTGAAVGATGEELLVAAPGADGARRGSVYPVSFGSTWVAGAAFLNPDLSSPDGPTAANAMNATFGYAIAIDGTTAAISAPWTGGDDHGRVFLFELTGGTWTSGPVLDAPAGLQYFGFAVDVDGDLVAVGAPRADGAVADGSAFVFRRGAPDYTQEDVTVPGAVAESDRFGYAVAISAETLIVGAPETNAGANDTGSVWTFVPGPPWTMGEQLLPTEIANARFGTSVALARGGLLLAVGAPGDGPVADDRRGVVYVYRRATVTDPWGVPEEISPDVPGGQFGTSVAFEDGGASTYLVVGAPLQNLSPTVMQTGAVYLYEERAGAFEPLARFRINPATPTPRAQLGTSVAISGDVVVAGGPGGTGPGIAAVFRVPLPGGASCSGDARCASGNCLDSNICCESPCDGMCQMCDGAGMCMAVEGCDAGASMPDVPFSGDAGPPVRVSGCRCGVAHTGGEGAGLLGIGVGLLLALRRRRGRMAAGAALALVLALGAPTVQAQDAAAVAVDPTEAEYQSAITNALREFEAHNYEEAYALFARAHELRPSARTERALGKAAFELRRYIESVRWLETSLTDERSPLTEEMRSEVTTLLTRARSFIGTFTATTPIEGAELLIDTVPLTGDLVAGIEFQLDLGAHDVSVRAPGYVTEDRHVVVRGAEHETLTFTLIEELGPVLPPDTTMRDLGWASLITGGALTVVGVVSIAVWADSVNTLNANLDGGACFADPVTENVIPGPGATLPNNTCLDLQSRYRLALPFAWAGFVGGGVFLATGLGLVLAAPTSGSADHAAVQCGPFGEAGVQCTGEF